MQWSLFARELHTTQQIVQGRENACSRIIGNTKTMPAATCQTLIVKRLTRLQIVFRRQGQLCELGEPGATGKRNRPRGRMV